MTDCDVPLQEQLDRKHGGMFDRCKCGLSNSECSWNKLPPRPDGLVVPWPFIIFVERDSEECDEGEP